MEITPFTRRGKGGVGFLLLTVLEMIGLSPLVDVDYC